MKLFFTIVLMLNLLIEGMAAYTLIGGPQGIAAAGTGGQWSMHYGFAAIAIASAGLWLWPYRSNRTAVTAVLGMLMTFHVGLFTSLSIAGDQQVGVITHAVMSLLCVGLFTQRSKWCPA